jgi:hypothetical protein
VEDLPVPLLWKNMVLGLFAGSNAIVQPDLGEAPRRGPRVAFGQDSEVRARTPVGFG